MNASQNDNSKSVTFNLPFAIHQQLKEWAVEHRTSMVAEVIRATRERSQRERKQARAAAKAEVA